VTWGLFWGRWWGGSSGAGPFALLHAWASAPNAFRVAFNKRPQLSSPIKPGDTSLISAWTLSRLDAAQPLTILAISPVYNEPEVLEFTIVQRWASAMAEYRIEASPLFRAYDEVEVITGGLTLDFKGTVQPDAPREQLLPSHIDLYSPQTSQVTVSGGLEVGSDGDFVRESGASLLKKIIQRHVVYRRDSFMHLAGQNFGLGMEPKGFQAGIDIVAEEATLEQAIRSEPEVESARVNITVYEDGRKEVHVKARTVYGTLDEAFLQDRSKTNG
jgi:hypothetical protein